MKQSLLVSLDCLLDTRLAILDLLNPDLALSITTDAKSMADYVTRLWDDWPQWGVDNQTFVEVYRARDEEILSTCINTALVYELKNILIAMMAEANAQPHLSGDIQIDINMAPYANLPEEASQAIVSAVRQHLGMLVPVEAVYYPYQSLSPMFFQSAQYANVFMYDFEEWLTHHYNMLTTNNDESLVIQNTVITVPNTIARHKDKIMEANNYKSPSGDTIDWRIGLEYVCLPYFKLEIVDVGMMSIPLPEYLQHYLRDDKGDLRNE